VKQNRNIGGLRSVLINSEKTAKLNVSQKPSVAIEISGVALVREH
jgi:hypothetical protein